MKVHIVVVYIILLCGLCTLGSRLKAQQVPSKRASPSSAPQQARPVQQPPRAASSSGQQRASGPGGAKKGAPFTKISAQVMHQINVGGSSVMHLIGGAHFSQGNANMTSDSAYIYSNENRLVAFGHVVIHQADTVTITGDHLNYDGNTRFAQMQNNCVMTDRQGVLHTDHLNYDLGTKIGTYFDGGKITNQDNILISRTGYYYENTKICYFKTDVSILTPQTTIKSDTMQYNTISRIAYFFGPTRITSKDDFIYCENGQYNTATDQANFSKHAYYLTGSNKLVGDSLYYDKRVGFGKSVGHVTYTDSVQNITFKGGLGQYNKLTETAFMTRKPLVILLTEHQDTLSDSLHRRDSLRRVDSLSKLKVTKPRREKNPSYADILAGKTEEIPQGQPGANPSHPPIPDLSASKKKKGVEKHLSDKSTVDSLFLTADTLKSILVAGDRARPQLASKYSMPSRNRPLAKDSLSKRADRLLEKIKKSVIEDSLRKKGLLVPGEKGLGSITKPGSLKKGKATGKGQSVETGQDSLQGRISTGGTPAQQDSLALPKEAGAKNGKRAKGTGLPRSDTLRKIAASPNSSKVSDSLKPSKKELKRRKKAQKAKEKAESLKDKKPGFFARLFGGGARIAPKDASHKRTSQNAKTIDSLKRRQQALKGQYKIPWLLEWAPDSLLSVRIHPFSFTDTVHYRVIFAYHHARMFKADFQAAADSLVYTYVDSTIRMFVKPALWTQGTQMTSDTLSIRLKNKKLDSLIMIRSAFIINQVDTLDNKLKFNQISGRDMFGKFENNKLYRMRVEGNGKSLYYASEEKTDSLTHKKKSTLSGLNSEISSYFLMRFQDNKVNLITSVDQPQGHFYPISKVQPGLERLRGFFLRESQRPKSKEDLFRLPDRKEIELDSAMNAKPAKTDSTSEDYSEDITSVRKKKKKDPKDKSKSVKKGGKAQPDSTEAPASHGSKVTLPAPNADSSSKGAPPVPSGDGNSKGAPPVPSGDGNNKGAPPASRELLLEEKTSLRD